MVIQPRLDHRGGALCQRTGSQVPPHRSAYLSGVIEVYALGWTSAHGGSIHLSSIWDVYAREKKVGLSPLGPVGLAGGSSAFPAVITLSALRKLRDERTSNRAEHAKMFVCFLHCLPFSPLN